MPFIIADPNLVGVGGHRLMYALALGGCAGKDAVVLANRSFDVLEPGSDGVVVPYFRRRSFELRAGEADLKRRVGSLLSRLGPAAGPALYALRRLKVALSALARDDSLAHDLLAWTDRRPEGRHDVLLADWASADVAAFAALIAGRPSAPDRLRLHALMLHDPVTDPSGVAALARVVARSGLAQMLRVYSDTRGLATAWQQALGVGVREVPVPVQLARPLTEMGAVVVSPDVLPGAAITVTYIGDAREEKGFDHLPAIISASEPLWRAGRIRFEVQATPGLRLDRDRYEATLSALGCFPDGVVTLVQGELDRTAYEDRLASAGIVLVPFSADSYRLRSSSILTEALALGIPAVVPAGTWLAETIGSRYGESYTEIGAAAHALARLVARYPEARRETLAAAPSRRRAGAPTEIYARLDCIEAS